MKYTYPFLILFIFNACSNEIKNEAANPKAIIKEDKTPQKIVKSDFQTIIDNANLEGAILIFDPQKKTYYSNDFAWAEEGRLPASTFKIPNSIIALETGIVQGINTIMPWDGQARNLERWNKEMTFKEAISVSCVPCYQDIARQIGTSRMNEYLSKLEFGNMTVDSTNIDLFWLVGDSKISQFEEIDFLQRFYNKELPIANRTHIILKEMLLIDKKENYTLSGKTGWAIRDEHNNGWFVGYINKGKEVYFFATNISPKANFDMTKFPAIRSIITKEAFEKMNII